ncbi:MAG: hypothetical protein ACPGPF_05935 [Pontibacterium sp.]
MSLETVISSSHAFMVTGGRHSGKLMLALALLQRANSKSPLLITPFEKTSSERKLSFVTELASQMMACESFDVLFATQGWREKKRDFGFHFLIDDISRVISNHPGDAVLLHRVDGFFEVQDRVHIELFVSALTQAAKSTNKKLVLTLSHDEALSQFQTNVERYMDLELQISKATSVNGNSRDVVVIYASQPLNESHYQLVRSDDTFSLQVAQEHATKAAPDSKIILVCESPVLAKRIEYLCASSRYRVEVCDESMQALLATLTTRPQLLICAAAPAFATSVAAIARDRKLPLVCISMSDYVRKLDRLQAQQQGCAAVLEKNFFVEDFAIAMQQALGEEVYIGIHALPKPPQFWTEETAVFARYVDSLLAQGIIFSVFELRLAELDEPSLKEKLTSRAADMVYFDPDTNTLKYLAVNLLGVHSDLICKKFVAYAQNVELISRQEAHQLQSGEWH